MGQPGIAIGGGGGYGFVAVGNILDFRAPGKGIQHADDGVAAETEDVLHIPALQIIHHQIGNKFFGHGENLLNVIGCVKAGSRDSAAGIDSASDIVAEYVASISFTFASSSAATVSGQ